MDTDTVTRKGGGPLDQVAAPVSLGRLLLGAAVGALGVWAFTAVGFWPIPLVLSLAWALLVPTTLAQYVGALGFSVLGYLIPLWVAARSEPIGRAAGVVAGIMGFGHDGLLVWGFTVILAALLALAGAWIGHAVRLLAATRRENAASGAKSRPPSAQA